MLFLSNGNISTVKNHILTLYLTAVVKSIIIILTIKNLLYLSKYYIIPHVKRQKSELNIKFNQN